MSGPQPYRQHPINVKQPARPAPPQKKNYFKKSCYESKKVCKLLKSLQTKPRDLDSFLSKTLKVKTDKKFLLNTELLRDFFLIFCCLVMEKFLITFSYFKIENFINNIHI